MNIREFAARCGVSPASASRILNLPLEESHASAKTYEKIRRQAVELGYAPNYGAKTLHTHRSNCIGVIIGVTSLVNVFPIISGVADSIYEHGYSIAVANCKNSVRLEALAFKNMLYRGVDAIIWHPVFQTGEFRTVHVERILNRYPKKLPVVCLSHNDAPGIFKFKANTEEDAKNAALRQLKLGCKKFAVFSNRYKVPQQLLSQKVYVTELMENGIPPEHIQTIVLNDTNNPPDWNKLRGIEGIWAGFLFMLYPFLPHMKHVCDFKKLHIDGQAFYEDWAISQWTAAFNSVEFENLFASIEYHIIDGTAVARRAAEIAITAMHNPHFEPFTESLVWKCGLPNIDAMSVLFK